MSGWWTNLNFFLEKPDYQRETCSWVFFLFELTEARKSRNTNWMFWRCTFKLSLLFSLLQMKTGPFAEHSNQLWNISAVPSWAKVNQGLIRMYKAEVIPSTALKGANNTRCSLFQGGQFWLEGWIYHFYNILSDESDFPRKCRKASLCRNSILVLVNMRPQWLVLVPYRKFTSGNWWSPCMWAVCFLRLLQFRLTVQTHAD